MYDFMEARKLLHKQQNYINAKRKKQGQKPFDLFPKKTWKFPNDNPLRLRTFIIYDELEKVKKMSMPDLLIYLFRNMLIYECNLIHDVNVQLGYYKNEVSVKVADFRQICPNVKTSKIPNCERVKNSLKFKFDLDLLTSLNSQYQKDYYEDDEAKARQYILFNFYIIINSFDILTPNCKDFLLFILSLYHYGKTPIIMHSLPNLLKKSNISLHEGKKKALDRINKYFYHLYRLGIIGDEYGGYEFKIEDLSNTAPLNLSLNPLIKHFSDD